MKRALTAVITVMMILLFTLHPIAVDNSALLENHVFDVKYYNQLNKSGKQVYNLFFDNLEDIKDGVSDITGEIDPIKDENRQAVMSSAFSAVRMDEVMLYFIDVTKLTITFTSYSSGKTTISIGMRNNETNYYRGSYSGREELEEEIANVNNVIDSIVSEASKKSSDYEKLKYVHDWIVTNNTYNTHVLEGNSEAAHESSWTVVSAFLSNNNPLEGPVCEGYAKAFMICAQRLGFECVLVPGYVISSGSRGGHMWNYVKLDGKWYAVDVTWDDPITNIPIFPVPTTYFLCGSDTDIGAGDTFSDIHEPDTGSYMYADFALPTLEKNAYPYVTSKLDTTCTASAATVTYGEQTAINVNISGDSTVNGGRVSVYNKTELIGSANVSGGKATIKAGLSAGNYSLTVKYEGNDSFEPSQSTVNCSVSKRNLTMRLKNSSVEDKMYDGTTSASVSMSVVFDGIVGNDNPKPASGYVVSAEFNNANPGNNKKVTLRITGIKMTDSNYSCAETFTATIYGNILPTPVTTPPVTDPPATDPPATDPPVTDPPATDPPATEPPATEPPATEPPATEPPATEPPATEPPATEPPATDPPATDPPATEPPMTDPPATASDTEPEVSATEGQSQSTAMPETVVTDGSSTENSSTAPSDTDISTEKTVTMDITDEVSTGNGGETISTTTIVVLLVVAGTVLTSAVVTVTVVIVKKR